LYLQRYSDSSQKDLNPIGSAESRSSLRGALTSQKKAPTKASPSSSNVSLSLFLSLAHSFSDLFLILLLIFSRFNFLHSTKYVGTYVLPIAKHNTVLYYSLTSFSSSLIPSPSLISVDMLIVECLENYGASKVLCAKLLFFSLMVFFFSHSDCHPNNRFALSSSLGVFLSSRMKSAFSLVLTSIKWLFVREWEAIYSKVFYNFDFGASLTWPKECCVSVSSLLVYTIIFFRSSLSIFITHLSPTSSDRCESIGEAHNSGHSDI
jgi:hypothetical protein